MAKVRCACCFHLPSFFFFFFFGLISKLSAARFPFDPQTRKAGGVTQVVFSLADPGNFFPR